MQRDLGDLTELQASDSQPRQREKDGSAIINNELMLDSLKITEENLGNIDIKNRTSNPKEESSQIQHYLIQNGSHKLHNNGSLNFTSLKVQEVNMVSGSPIQRPYTDIPIKGRLDDQHGIRTPRDYRKEPSSRKECARRHLMGFLFNRQPPMKRSNTFVAGERPATEVHFPQLLRREGHKTPGEHSRTPEIQARHGGNRLRRTQSYKSAPAIEGNAAHVERATNDELYGRVRSNSTGTKLNLPELIHDINNSVNCRNELCNTHEETYSVLEAINQDITSLTDFDLLHGGRNSGKFRPITPGLIAKLNKVRVSSKNRTEQWIRALPLDHRGTHIGEEYREQWNKPPPRHVQWIYDKTERIENNQNSDV